MAIEDLLKNPEQYRAGENYKASNIVFPVEFEGQKYIVKKPRMASSLIEPYYVLQDKFFLGTRILSTAHQRLGMEAEKLKSLNGLHAPRLVAYDNKILVREYLEGRDFRSLDSDEERKSALECAIEALIDIHMRGTCIGDAHVKNIFVRNSNACWLDMDGVYNGAAIDCNLTLIRFGAAMDLLRVVYSTYTATRNPNLTVYSAELVAKNGCHVSDGRQTEVGRTIKWAVSKLQAGFGLWFATRMPRDGKLNNEIKKIISS